MKVKNDKLNCIIGDIVDFDENEKVINKIYKRKNFLYRPLISNIDYIGILFSLVNPKFDMNVFQRMLLSAYEQNIPFILILSKIDLLTGEELREKIGEIERIFKGKFPIFPISVKTREGLENLQRHIRGKSVTVFGPSGVGKSSLINELLGEEILVTNEVSSKTLRGRHTTTESRFFKAEADTFLIDTPGFSSLDFPKLQDKKDLEKLFPEFYDYIPNCKFRDCVHLEEPSCAIKENVENGNISMERYEFYTFALKSIFEKNY